MTSVLEPAAAARPSPPSKDFWDKLKIVMPVVVIPLLAVLLPVAINYREQLVSERQAAGRRADEERQIQARAEEARRQQAVSQAQLASVLLPIITRGDGQERQSALEVLSFVAPELAQRLAEVLIAKAATPTDKVFATRLAQASRRAAQVSEFNNLVDVARSYWEVALHPECARAYLKAFDVAPEDMKSRLNAVVERGRALYQSNEFRPACLELEPAFARAQ